MFTLVLFTVVAIVAIIGSIKMYNQLSRIQSDISAIKKDNERRIEFNRQRNEKRKERDINNKKQERRAEVMSKMQSVDKRG
jgi:hypothetical protein